MGRKIYEFDERTVSQIKALARCHCPDHEIAAFAGCSERTLKRRFRKILHEERQKGIANLRAKQYELAMKGDKTMLVWVGKQIAGQSDKVRHDNKNLVGGKIAIHRFADKDVLETFPLLSAVKKDEPAPEK
jgi:AraC-like DNA-binding protein